MLFFCPQWKTAHERGVDGDKAVGSTEGSRFGVGAIEEQLIEERAHSVALDHKLRQLGGQLVQTMQSSQQLRRSWLPVLHGIEARLMHLAGSGVELAD